jgi:hypothetical protein
MENRQDWSLFKHIAYRKIRLLSTRSGLWAFSTIWKGEVVSIWFNPKFNDIDSVTASQDLEQEDFNALNKIILDFLS